MSDVTHTPGEWRMSEIEGGFLITMGTALKRPYNCETHHLVEMDFSLYPEDGEQYDEAKANAKLMASAPELLEALSWFINDIDGTHTVMVEFDKNVEKARAAILKATGRTA